jgi:hypothetical protein
MCHAPLNSVQGSSKMRGVRGAIPAFFFVVMLVSGCRTQDKPVLSRSPLSEEQLSVYRGFLDKFSSLNFKNLSSVTIPFNFKGFPDTRPCLEGIELENVSESLRTAHTFGSEITKGRDLRLVNPIEQEKLLQQQVAPASSQKEKSSDGVQKANSDANFLTLSEIIFDKKHQFTVLKYLVVCGVHGLYGATLVMETVDGKWTASSSRPCAVFIDY